MVSFFRVDALRLRPVALAPGGAPSSFAAEEAVGAVADAGRRTALVGDFGRILLSGEVFGAFFDTLFDETDGAGWRVLAAWAVVVVEAKDVRLGF